MRKKATLAIVDDHRLFRSGIASLISSLDNNRYQIIFEASSGVDLLQRLAKGPVPNLLILDINMPDMNGFETAKQLAIKYPSIKIIVLSMLDDDDAILKMLKLGVKGYLQKNSEPEDFNETLQEVLEKGHSFSKRVSNLAIKALNGYSQVANTIDVLNGLNPKELQFVKLMGTDMTYQEMADEMGVSYKSVDKYRDSVFSKVNVKSRVGLVLVLVKHGIITKESIV